VLPASPVASMETTCCMDGRCLGSRREHSTPTSTHFVAIATYWSVTSFLSNKFVNSFSGCSCILLICAPNEKNIWKKWIIWSSAVSLRETGHQLPVSCQSCYLLPSYVLIYSAILQTYPFFMATRKTVMFLCCSAHVANGLKEHDTKGVHIGLGWRSRFI